MSFFFDNTPFPVRFHGMHPGYRGISVNFHSKCKILGGVAEFFSKAFLCRFPPENFPRPVVYPVHSLPV